MTAIRLRDNPDELAALIARASSERAISQAFIEKDFWVTEVLRSVAQPLDAFIAPAVQTVPRVILKGGTSLSRAYRLIERFSEDIDILVAHGSLVVGGSQLDKLMEKIDKRARPEVLRDGTSARESRGKKGIYRNTEYDYPTRIPDDALRPYVYLEMGVRGGAMPTDERLIRSLLADICIGDLGIDEPVAEFAGFAMEVLAPHRTLIEKLAALHTAGAQVDTNPNALRPLGRHLYDVHALLSSDEVTERLRGDDDAPTLAADCHRISLLYGWPSTPRPAAGYASSNTFQTGSDAEAALRAAYALVGSLVYGDVPTFEDCIATIQANAELL